MKFPTKRCLALSLAVSCLTPVAVFATNGMFMIGYGAKSVGAGGTAIAFPQDSLAGAVNPATISEMGIRADVSAELFLPHASARLGNMTQDSRADTFIIPNMGGAMKFNRKLAFGFTAVGAGGGGSRYNQNLYNNSSGDSSQNATTLGVSLMVMQMNPTVAFKLTRHQSVGASVVIGAQQFRAFGLKYFNRFASGATPASDAPYLTNNGNAYAQGFGLRLGWLGTFFDEQLTLGASGTTKVFMSRFGKYADLFAQNGRLETPANIGAGLAFKMSKDLTVALDVQKVFYSGVNAIANLPPPTSGGPADIHDMGLDAGYGFGWDNQIIYKLGAAYTLNDQWTVRAGWNYGKSPIPSDNGAILVNIVAPATTQNHATIGATYSPSPNTEFSFSYMHAFRYTQYGPTLIGDTGEIGMSQDSFGASVGLKF